MKILVWRGKHGDQYFNIADENKALKFLFTIIDTEYGYYNPDDMGSYNAALYKKAKDGDMVALRKFMHTRSVHEYEEWEFEDPWIEEEFKQKFGKDL